jgi:hypothetical protein
VIVGSSSQRFKTHKRQQHILFHEIHDISRWGRRRLSPSDAPRPLKKTLKTLWKTLFLRSPLTCQAPPVEVVVAEEEEEDGVVLPHHPTPPVPAAQRENPGPLPLLPQRLMKRSQSMPRPLL